MTQRLKDGLKQTKCEVSTNCKKDLGIIFDNNLKRHNQVSKATSIKLNSCTTTETKSKVVRRSIYLLQVRCKIGYTNQVWAPQTSVE